jgi:hypothetical protein
MRRFLSLALLLLIAATSPTVEFDVQIGQPPTIVYNIANAPAWQPATNYVHVGHFGDRVLAGPALSSGASPTYTDGLPLYLLELTKSGSSGTSQPAIATCPSTDIADGTNIWRCLAKVAYPTITSAFIDDAAEWKPHTADCDGTLKDGCYYPRQIVRANGQSWFNQQDNNYAAFVPPINQCSSATSGSGPSGTTSPQWEGTCQWIRLGSIPYSASHDNAWPHQLWPRGSWPVQIAASMQRRVFRIWHGGIARPAYVGGVNGEAKPIGSSGHTTNEGQACPNTPDDVGSWQWTAGQSCSPPQQWPLAIIAASGEGFCDVPLASPPAYDPTRGVAIEDDGAPAFLDNEMGTTTSCLQFKDIGAGNHQFGMEFHGGNHMFINNLVDSAADITWGFQGGGSLLINNILINRSNAANAQVVMTKYVSHFVNNTIIMTGSGANRSAFVQHCNNEFAGSFGEPPESLIQNNLIFGAAHLLAMSSQDWCTPVPWTGQRATNNLSDSANEGGAVWDSGGWGEYKAVALAGTNNLFGRSAADVFVAPGSDLRLKPGSIAIGAGVAYVPLSGYDLFNPGMMNNGSDMFRGARGARIDVGAIQGQ